MPSSMPEEVHDVHDVIGIGFGPSNLGLAVAIEEWNSRSAPGDRVSALFLEKQESFGWHRGMLIEDATMQVSFLKDLVTLRDPASSFSFLSYLHARHRLVDFINHKEFFPTRIEFHDYLEWVAGRLGHLARFGSEVVDINPVRLESGVELFDVVVGAADGSSRTYRTRNVSLALGLRPHLPDWAGRSDRITHNRDLMFDLPGFTEGAGGRFLVVGAGQSAAETVACLHREYPEAEVYGSFSRYGYAPADNSAFVNQIFDPAAVDDFFVAPDEVKDMIFDYHRQANYSAVDLDLIDDLYHRMYVEKVNGRQRLHMLKASKVAGVEPRGRKVAATIEFLTTGVREEIEFDAIVCATGYRGFDPSVLLGELTRFCVRDDSDSLRVLRDYRLETTAEVRGGVYLQGPTERTHGISSTLLSNVAIRAGEILESLLARRESARAAGAPEYEAGRLAVESR